MHSPIEINGKQFVTVKQAAESFGYSRDHVTRLAKGKKIKATQFGRLWFVNEASFQNYCEDQQAEAEVKKHLLSKQRQFELQLRSAVASSGNRTVNTSQQSGMLSVVCAFLFFGLLLGAASQVVPQVSALPASLVYTTSDAPLYTPESNTVQPVFTHTGSVLVGDTDRWVEKPEVTSHWVQITP